MVAHRDADGKTLLQPATEMGAGIAASPHMRRVWICRCSLGAEPEGPPLCDPDSPAQASLPIRMDPRILTLSFPRPIPKDARLLRKRFASARRLWRPDLPRPFLGWFPSRGLSPWGGNRPRKARNQLFRRLLPTGPVLRSAASSPRGAVLLRISRPSPAGGDRTFRPVLTFQSLPTIRRGWDFRPDHHWNMRIIPSRAKRNLRHQACG